MYQVPKPKNQYSRKTIATTQRAAVFGILSYLWDDLSPLLTDSNALKYRFVWKHLCMVDALSGKQEKCLHDNLNRLDSFVTLPLWLPWEFVLLIPLVEEVNRPAQANHQQGNTEQDDHHLFFAHWPRNKLRDATPGAIIAPFTLAVVFFEVHKENAFAVVQAVVVKLAFTVYN